MGESMSVRQPAVAGSFYPRDPRKLASDIDRLIDSAAVESPPGRILAAVSPHAGYLYSGPVAAPAYRLVRNKNVHTAVVISPSHMEYFDHSSVFDGDGYETPLGVVKTAGDLARKLARGDHVKYSSRGHIQAHLPRQEHALEVQIPFLQRSLDSFALVPVVMGDQSWDRCAGLGRALAPLLEDPGVLVVASTDLSHFYNAEKAAKLDGKFVDYLVALDARGLFDSIESRGCEACGAGPVIAAMLATGAFNGRTCTVLKQASSGDITGDFDSVVGYLSAVITRPD